MTTPPTSMNDSLSTGILIPLPQLNPVSEAKHLAQIAVVSSIFTLFFGVAAIVVATTDPLRARVLLAGTIACALFTLAVLGRLYLVKQAEISFRN